VFRVTKPLTLWLGTLVFLAISPEADPAAGGRPLAVSIETIVNPVDGSPGPRCVAAGEVESSKQMESWIEFGEAKLQPPGAWEGTSSRIRCGAGPWDKASSDLGRLPKTPYLVVGVSMAARPLPEAVRLLEISLTRRRLSGVGRDGVPVYEQSVEKRSLFFSTEGETFIPLLVSDATERQAFGIHEVLVKLDVRRLKGEPAAAYGVISVTSGANGAEVLLDGGVVGTISSGRDTVLRNVRVGEREVGIRDSSGRETRRLVRVEENRMVLVALDLPYRARHGIPYRLVSRGENSQGYEEYRRRRDGARVVKIPAGEYLMGNKETERTPLEHKVYVSSFLIDKTPVTWGQYKRFAEATGTALPPDLPWWGIHDDHPAVFVTWEEGKAYCEWVGGRLPTEAEWEKAARGTDGRMYPWGNEEPDPQRAVYRRSWGFAATDPVGAHPSGASPYGLVDMGGTVWEWCADWYDDKYYSVSPARDPRGPSSGQAHVVRGGSWDSRPSVLSCSCRSWGYRGYREGDFGFRCAMDPPE
jgi:formylglycine-generating enzyme required for sulfatase activity